MKGMRVVWVTALLSGLLLAVVGVGERMGFGQTPTPASSGGGNGTAMSSGLVAGAPVEGSLAEAKNLAAKGRLDQALAELNELAKVVPEEAGVERLLGIVLYQKDALAEAEKAFGRAIEQDASDRESVEMRGITLYRLGRPGEAIPLLEGARRMETGTEGPGTGKQGTGVRAAPEVDPTSENPDVGHPERQGIGNKEQGTEVLEAAARVNADPSYVLGLCYADAKRYDDARKAFAEQFGFGADSAEGYLVTARLFLRREFVDESEIFTRKALELDPQLPLAHQLLGEIALARADLPMAVKELEAEEKLNPLNAGMYDRLGDAYSRNGQFEQARQALNKSILLDPNATGPYILLGQALIKLGDPVQALHYLDRAVTMDPGNHVTHFALGQAYSALGRTVEAHREFKMSVDMQHKTDPKQVAPKPAAGSRD